MDFVVVDDVVVVIVVVFNDVEEVDVGAVSGSVVVVNVVVDGETFDVCLVVDEITDLVVLDVGVVLIVVVGFTDDEETVTFVLVSLAIKEDEF